MFWSHITTNMSRGYIDAERAHVTRILQDACERNKHTITTICIRLTHTILYLKVIYQFCALEVE